MMMNNSNSTNGERDKVLPGFIEIVYISLLSSVEFFVLQLSCDIKDYIPSMIMVLLNIFILIIFNILIGIVFTNLKVFTLLSFLVMSVVSLINYYIIVLHGSPLNIDEIKNAATALNVLSAYSIRIDRVPALIVSLICLVCFAVLLLKNKLFHRIKRFTITKSILLLVSITYIVFSYASSRRPLFVIDWSWQYSYGTYGFVSCGLEDIYSRHRIIKKPYAYDETETYNLAYSFTTQHGNDNNVGTVIARSLPDIILILNETFYDLKRVYNIYTDNDPLAMIQSMDEVYYGYVVVPTIGGGTNQSEYELLTSNSLSLMRNNITPFNVLDLEDANSIVKNLKDSGYVTIGSHPEPALNYNRKNAYYKLGFEYIYFDNDFEDVEYYGNRHFKSDISVYRNLINWYDEAKEEGPVFAYLLTIQNHAEYNSNDASFDVIHVLDQEKDQSIANEYLTCIHQSDEAFYELTRYFKDSDRPVVIAMVGDHCPAFAKELLDGEHDEALNIFLRETPAYIWANYDLGIEDHDLGEMGLISFVPTLLDMAGVPSNAYYDYILEMKKSIPILTVEGDVYADAYHKLSNDNEMLKNYQYLEYLNLKEPDWEK